jgi:hypothetical protein
MNNVNKSNMNLNQVLEICVQRDWKGFDPTWIQNNNQATQHLKADKRHLWPITCNRK